jgi:hypothetical protein
MAFWSFLHGEKQQPTATGETKPKKYVYSIYRMCCAVVFVF